MIILVRKSCSSRAFIRPFMCPPRSFCKCPGCPQSHRHSRASLCPTGSVGTRSLCRASQPPVSAGVRFPCEGGPGPCPLKLTGIAFKLSIMLCPLNLPLNSCLVPKTKGSPASQTVQSRAQHSNSRQGRYHYGPGLLGSRLSSRNCHGLCTGSSISTVWAPACDGGSGAHLPC